MKQQQNVMWNGTCNHLDLAGQIKTARLSGCNVLSITPLDFERWKAEGISARDIRAMADDQGVAVSHMDPIARWAPKWIPNNIDDASLPFFAMETDEFLSLADELGCESFTAICTFPYGEVSTAELTEAFAELCRHASGFRVDLEFVPLWGLRDLATAWDVVKGADAANGGLLFDFWHFFRSAADFDLLRSIPTRKIHSVQACDARYAPLPGRTPLQDTLEDREPLGEGEFPVDEIIKTLAEKGALQCVGPEYFCRKLRGLSPEELADVVDRTYWSRITQHGVTRS